MRDKFRYAFAAGMAGHSRPRDGVASLAYDPTISLRGAQRRRPGLWNRMLDTVAYLFTLLP